MNTKKIWVSFLAIAIVLFLAASVSAAEITTNYEVRVNDQNAYTNNVSVNQNDKIEIYVAFTSLVNDKDVTVKADLRVGRERISVDTPVFDIETGARYAKTLTLRIPEGLKDDVSGNVELEITISGNDHESELNDVILRVQRESYSIKILSVTTGTLKAGQVVPVDVVVKNIGYNDLDDTYVMVRIPALGVQRTAYFGDLVSLENNTNDDDETDTVSGRLFLEIPYNAKSGVYALEVAVSNGDATASAVKEVSISNQFSSGNIIVSGESLLIVNPTNELLVYRLVPESTKELSVSLEQSVIAVPAGSSKTVDVTATGLKEGTYSYKINVFSIDGELISTVTLTKTVSGGTSSSPVVALTVVLAIIFVVLLVVLIVLMGKKPEKSEEFGESYY